MGSHVAAPRVRAAPVVRSRLPAQPASHAEQAAPPEPSAAETLLLHLHNAELPLRWERRSWDARQGTRHPARAPGRTASERQTHPAGRGAGARDFPSLWEAAARRHHGWGGGRETPSPARAAGAACRSVQGRWWPCPWARGGGCGHGLLLSNSSPLGQDPRCSRRASVCSAEVGSKRRCQGTGVSPHRCPSVPLAVVPKPVLRALACVVSREAPSHPASRRPDASLVWGLLG